ncbi:MAG TPA: sigma-E factor regulatory protein RseB domain-containing protein, partial [Chromatiaceae bacterium]|nr:sigma-E factor regulatory protein RseB domain-containing protein [Chromatiaceae bacterium]
MISLALLASLATAPLTASPPADRDPDLEPFERMGQALGSLSYEGILVYSHENRMETLRIQQRVVDGRVQAVLESLNGQPRHIQQDGPQVICRLSGEHLIAVAQRALSQQTPAGLPLKARELAPHYLVQSQGQTRVAGRPTQV